MEFDAHGDRGTKADRDRKREDKCKESTYLKFDAHTETERERGRQRQTERGQMQKQQMDLPGI